MEKKLVVANGHGPVPMHENSRRYITDTSVLVPMNTYYHRRIATGELAFAAEAKPKQADTSALDSKGGK